MEKKSIFKKIHNDGFTWHDSIATIILIFLTLMICTELFASNLGLFAERKFPLLTEGGFWTMFYKYFMSIFIWIVFVAYCALTKYNKFILKEITPAAKGNTVKMLLIGLLIGGGQNALGIIIAALVGDIHLQFTGCNIIGFIFMFLAVFIQSSSEEFTCRAFLYQRLKKGYRSPWVAIIGNAVIFMSLHLFNPGISVIPIIHLTFVAIFYSLFVYYFDSIWLPMGIHAAWNFTQNIIFGLPNSGIVSSFSMMKLEASTGNITFFYDPIFGVEGSAFMLLVTTILAVIVLITGEKRKRKTTA